MNNPLYMIPVFLVTDYRYLREIFFVADNHYGRIIFWLSITIIRDGFIFSHQ